MKDEYKQLQGIMTQRHLKPFKLSKVIGVSIVALTNYLAGMPVSESQEALLVAYVEGVI